MCKLCDSLTPGNCVGISQAPMLTHQHAVFGGASVCVRESLKNVVYLTVETWLGDVTTGLADEEISYCPFCGKKFNK